MSGATNAPSGAAATTGQGQYTGTGLSSVADVLTMTFLSSSVTLTNGSGGTVTVNDFTITPNLSISLLNPTATPNIGGKMSFTAASTPGTYNGSVQVRGTGLLSGSATMTLPITVTLWRALGISQTTPLRFGRIEMRGGNSVVRIIPQNGMRTVTSGTAGVSLIASGPGNAGEFAVTGNPSTAVTITLPTSITLTGPGAAMTVNNFNRFPATANPTLDASGNLTLRVGADLNIGTAQASGTYNGTYQITVSY